VGSDNAADTAPVEQPILWLGMAGFTPQQRGVLEPLLVRTGEMVRWRVGAFGDADAWWVNGAKVGLLPGGNLRVAAGLPSEHALNLNLSEVDRPVAFALPLAGDDLEPRCTFDPASDASVQAVLLQFENWLWLTRAQFVLGAQIVHRGAELRGGIYHVSHAGRLLAVLDFHLGQAALLPRAHPVDLWAARWDRRPIGARDLPEAFTRATPAQLAWTYVRRTERDLLPPRYRSGKIYYRHVPGVPLRWLRDSQLLVLRELSVEPATLQSLCQRTGMPAGDVEHDLTCLYYAGAVTTTRGKAAPPAQPRDSQPHSVGAGWDSLLRGGSAVQHDLTAPALLERRPWSNSV
jgi:hypothetical protein